MNAITIIMNELTIMMLMILGSSSNTATSEASLRVTDLSSTRGICTQGYFQCENDTLCFPQENNCDGIQHCPSGSDEKNCNDAYVNNFYDHLYRKRIAAEHDYISSTSCQLEYNGPCLCKAKDLFCRFQHLKTIPDDLPDEDIDILDLSGNNFTVLSYSSMKNIPSEVGQLALTDCGIEEIKEGAFFNLTTASTLVLRTNKIKIIPEGLFQAENSLHVLFLTYNEISVIHPNAFKELSQLEELDLRGNRLTEIKREVFEPLKNLLFLYLQQNQVSKVSPDTFPEIPLTELSLVENRISELEPEAFTRLHTLVHLFLASNRLTHLKNGTFKNLDNLEFLTLNNNSIDVLEEGVFADTTNLISLNLVKNRLRDLDDCSLKPMFLPLQKLQYIYFDRFELCSAAKHVRVCSPKGDGISSDMHLLDNTVLRASVWVMGFIGCCGNLIVLINRLVTPTNNQVHSLYLRNLALSDLLMGVYLFTIASADLNYRGVYLTYQYKWRHSTFCSLCGFLSTLSCESSVLILSLVTWDRLMSVTRPLARRQPSPVAAALTLLALWVIAAAVAVVPLVPFSQDYFQWEFYSNNGVCLSLHIHDPYLMGWEYSATMFIGGNSLALMFICYAYLRMIREIKASSVACRSTRQSQERDRVAQRFGVIILTDCLCWVPVIVVKLLALSGVPIPQDLYAWLAIFVLPIHSALNPVLYTLTTTVFKKQMRRVINSCLYKKKRPVEPQHSASDSGFSLSLGGVFPIGGSTRRILSYRGTQSSVMTSKNSWKRQATAV